MSDLLNELKNLRASVDSKQAHILATAESALKEAQNNGTLSLEAKALADKALAELNSERQKLNDLETRLSEAETVFASLPSASKAISTPSVGEQVANNEQMRSFLAQAAMGSRGSLTVKAVIKNQNGTPSLAMPHHVGLAQAAQQRLFIRDLISPGKTESNAVEFVRETGFTNNANVVEEGSMKPESQITFEPAVANVATIAHWTHATTQVLSDVPMLESYINSRLLYGLKLKEETQLLKGSGAALNIKGLYTAATAYNNSGVTVTAENLVDKLRLAMLQVELTGDFCQGIVLNPADWAGIELLKNDKGEYLLANPFNQTMPRLWGIPVVATQALAKGEFLTGAFATAAQLWDREDASVAVSYEDRDNFVKNMVTIRCEERLALTIYRPEAFVKNAG